MMIATLNNNLTNVLFYIQDSGGEGNESDSDSDIPDELKQDYIDELTGEARSHRLIYNVFLRI